jgi:hypothetical protein
MRRSLFDFDQQVASAFAKFFAGFPNAITGRRCLALVAVNCLPKKSKGDTS